MSGEDGAAQFRGTALVTGATGFIGGRLVSSLRDAGYRVRALVRDPNALPPRDGVEPFEGDLARPDSLDGIERGVDVVVHSASILGKWGTTEDELRRVNVDGALALLERFVGSPVKRYLHLSAGGVTGPLSGGPVDERYLCRPATAYERTKLEGERRVLQRAETAGVPLLVARPTFTYGPGDPHKLALFRAVKKGRFAFIGDGRSVNHPVYIDDLLYGLTCVLERGKDGRIYIIGGERPVTKRELIHTIADVLEVPRPRFHIPLPLARVAAAGMEWVGERVGVEPILTRGRVMMMADNFGYSIDRARKELGYEPRMPLDRGIAATVAAYRAEGKL